MTTLALTDSDRCLIDQAYQLALMSLPKPITRETCDLCAKIRVPCIAHRGPNDWPQPKGTE